MRQADWVSPVEHLVVGACSSLVRLNLNCFPSLKEITLEGCGMLQTTDLHRCKSLLKLKLDSCSAMTDLSVGGAACLQSIALSGMTSLLTLNIRECDGLRSLKLRECAITELDCDRCYSLLTITLHQCRAIKRVSAVRLSDLITLTIEDSPRLTDVCLIGSHCLRNSGIGPESPLGVLNLSAAPELAVSFSPSGIPALCPVCASCRCDTGLRGKFVVTYGFIHGATVHRICHSCALKVTRLVNTEGDLETSLLCPVCAEPGHVALF